MTDASGSNQPTDPTAGAPVPPAPQPPRKKVPLAVKIIAPVLGVVVGIGVYAGVRAAFDAAAGPSKQMLIEKAVWGMMPKTKLGKAMVKKLKVYAGPDHKHEAQSPEPLDIRKDK